MPARFEFRTVLIACLIVSIGQLSVGLLFPALPAISETFDISSDSTQALISLYLLGFGSSQLVYGPLSDTFGRRPVLLTGLLIALAGIALSLFGSAHFEMLVAGRFLQGVGAGCCAVLSRACIRDNYNGAELSTALSWLAIVASFTPIVAPLFGGIVNHYFGWGSVFAVMFGYVLLVWLVLVMRFEETLKDVRLPPSLRTTLRNYRGLFSSRHFLSFAAIGWLNYTLVVVAISLMPFIMQVQLGLTSEEYALWALLPAVGLMCGGILSNRLRRRFSERQVLILAPVIQVSAGLWFVLVTPSPLLMMLGQFSMAMANGVAFPNAQAMLMQPYGGNKAGTTAALSGACQMVFASVISATLMKAGMSQAWHLGILLIVGAGISISLIQSGFRITPDNEDSSSQPPGDIAQKQNSPV